MQTGSQVTAEPVPGSIAAGHPSALHVSGGCGGVWLPELLDPVKAKNLQGYGEVVWNLFFLSQKQRFHLLIKCSCLHGNMTGVVYLFAFNN